jgi:hypothetical protein
MNETWHTPLFDVYNCVDVFRIENNCHMLEIKGQVAFFNGFFLRFLSLSNVILFSTLSGT